MHPYAYACGPLAEEGRCALTVAGAIQEEIENGEREGAELCGLSFLLLAC